MPIQKVTLDQYADLRLIPTNVFGRIEFLKLNRHKADDGVEAYSDGRVGVVFGCREGRLHLHWSAPYMSLGVADETVTDDEIAAFGQNLREMLGNMSVRIITPPAVYNGPESKFADAFQRPGDTMTENPTYYVRLENAGDETKWARDARRNLRLALRHELKLELATDVIECYGLIARHHQDKRYPLALTPSEIALTAEILPVDFWTVKKAENSVAAAVCYHVTSDIVQIINVGDTLAGRDMHAVTFLLKALIDHYRQKMVAAEGHRDALLDYGPSNFSDGSPNPALARFKMAHGFQSSPKTTIITL